MLNQEFFFHISHLLSLAVRNRCFDFQNYIVRNDRDNMKKLLFPTDTAPRISREDEVWFKVNKIGIISNYVDILRNVLAAISWKCFIDGASLSPELAQYMRWTDKVLSDNTSLKQAVVHWGEVRTQNYFKYFVYWFGGYSQMAHVPDHEDDREDDDSDYFDDSDHFDDDDDDALIDVINVHDYQAVGLSGQPQGESPEEQCHETQSQCDDNVKVSGYLTDDQTIIYDDGLQDLSLIHI